MRSGLLNRTHEIAFYISNRTLRAEPAATAIRAHWAIETTSHYSRDVIFNEDRSRIRKTPECLRACEVLASTSSRPTGKAASARTATALPSAGLSGLSELANI